MVCKQKGKKKTREAPPLSGSVREPLFFLSLVDRKDYIVLQAPTPPGGVAAGEIIWLGAKSMTMPIPGAV